MPAGTCSVIGTGHYLPERVVDNHELAGFLHCDPAGIEKRVGIRSRRWVEGRVYTSDLAVLASREAAQSARMGLEELDCIIAATQCPDHANPGIGVYIQAKLGLKRIPCYDIRNQCSGFLYSLQIARGFLAAGFHRKILVVCAELHSHGLARQPDFANLTPLFGDGAGAVIVSDGPGPGPGLKVAWLKVYADGRGAAHLRQRVWDVSLTPPWDLSQSEDPRDKILYGEMNGEEVFLSAVRQMTSVARECLRENGLKPADIDFFVPHQANMAILKTVVSILEIPEAKLLTNMEWVGNTSAASIPILLSQAVGEGRLREGQRILCLAFGAGFTWGAALLEVVDAAADVA